MVLRVADLLCVGDRILGHGKTRDPVLLEGVEIVDPVPREVSQPRLFGLIVVAVYPDAQRQVGEDVDVVAAVIHRLDRLLHVNRVVSRAGPGQVDVVAFPEGRRRQYDVGVPGGRCQEMVLPDDEFHAIQRLGGLLRVRRLIEQIAAARIDKLDVRRIAAALTAREQIGEQRRGHFRVDRILADGQAGDPAISGRPVAGAGIAAGNARVAGDRRERVGGAMELFSVGAASRPVAAMNRGGFRLTEFDREPADRVRRDAGNRRRPFRCLGDAVGLAHQIGAIGRSGRHAIRQGCLVEPQHVAVAKGLIVQAFTDDDVGHGDQRGGVGGRPDENMLVGEQLAGAGSPRVDADDPRPLLFRVFQVRDRSRAEGPVAGRPAPHDDQLGVDVIGRLPAGGLVVRFRPERHRDGIFLRLAGHVRPHIGAAAEHVQETP